MISRMRLTCCVSLTCMLTFGAPPGSQGDLTHIEAASPTPVLDVIADLIAKHRWAIHFEDWGEVKDERLKEIFGTNGQRWLVRQPSAISLDIPSIETLPKDQRGHVMAQILDSHLGSVPPVAFGSSYDGATLQVFPVAVRAADGTLRRVRPLLDTPVSIPLGKYSLGEIVSRIVAQVEEKRGVSIVLGTIPRFISHQDSVTEEALDEPARDLLVRAFGDINDPLLARADDCVVPVWSLRYEPTAKRFYLNIDIAEHIPFSQMASQDGQQPRQTEIRRTKPKSATGVLDPATATKQ